MLQSTIPTLDIHYTQRSQTSGHHLHSIELIVADCGDRRRATAAGRECVACQPDRRSPWETDNPALVNESPFDNGWLFKLKLSQPEELNSLLDAAGYQAKISH